MSTTKKENIPLKSRGRPPSEPKHRYGKRLEVLSGGENFADFCRKHDLPVSRLSKYRTKETTPGADILELIVEKTGCDPGWLLTGKGEPYPERTAARSPKGPILLPFAGRAAGDDSGGTRVEFDHDGEALELPPHTAIIQVHGDSMAPLIRDGQYALIDDNHRGPHDGDIVALQSTRGATYCKRFHWMGGRKGSRTICLESINPLSPQKPIQLNEDDIDTVRVVVGVWYG